MIGKEKAWADPPKPFPSVFDHIGPRDVRLDPFPHIVKEGALDPALCARLVATRQHHHDLSPTAQGAPSNQRVVFHAFAMRTPDMIDDAWKAFARTHASAEVTLRVAETFAEHWPKHLPDATWLRQAKYGMVGANTYREADVLTDARLELIGPSTGAPWSHRAGHVDTGTRLFSALYYLRAPDDETQGGGLDLFRYKDGSPDKVNVFEFESHQVEKVATIPYRANTLVVFPNSPLAIHGSEPRGYSERDRAYAFITAEVENNLF